MMERVYLSDWLFNAGIIGFIKILTEAKSLEDLQNQNIIQIGENYIEFDRSSLRGFTEKFFNTAFNRYGRYKNLINIFNSYLEDVEKVQKSENLEEIASKYKISNDGELKEKIILEIFNRFKKILDGFKYLKSGINLPSKDEVRTDAEKLKDVIQEALKIMKDNYNDILESDVQIYLRKMYGQKSFLNKSMTSHLKEKFFEDFEKPIVENSIKHEKVLKCVNCGRPAKKGASFDTGISPFFGLNKDAINFAWDFNTELPLCEICELIYFCSFAAFTPSAKSNGKVFYFVNSDSSVEELFKENELFYSVLYANPFKTDLNDSLLFRFFAELILSLEKEKSEFALENIAVIKLDLSSDVLPKVYGFNIPKNKAQFIKNNSKNFEGLLKKRYKLNDETNYIVEEILDLILKDSLTYDYLYKLTRLIIASNGGKVKSYEAMFNSYDLQVINVLISSFIKDILNRRWKMSDEKENKELWYMYHSGSELSKKMRSLKAENKIPSIAYKLLNALKIGDVNDFMDVLMRTCMAYGTEVPALMVKVLKDKEAFYPLGYSFLNGFLSSSDNLTANSNETKEA